MAVFRLRGLACAWALSWAAALTVGASPAGARPFTAHDLATLPRLSDAHLSPDGRHIVYDLRTTDYAANKSAHAIWVVDAAAGAEPRRLAVSDGGATSPRWSGDGKAIYFLSGRGGSDQVWKTDLAGLTAVQVTRLPLDVGIHPVSAAAQVSGL